MHHEDETTIADPERIMCDSQCSHCNPVLAALGTTRLQQCAGLAPVAGNTPRASVARPVDLHYQPTGCASNRRRSNARNCFASLLRKHHETTPGTEPARISGR